MGAGRQDCAAGNFDSKPRPVELFISLRLNVSDCAFLCRGRVFRFGDRVRFVCEAGARMRRRGAGWGSVGLCVFGHEFFHRGAIGFVSEFAGLPGGSVGLCIFGHEFCFSGRAIGFISQARVEPDSGLQRP